MDKIPNFIAITGPAGAGKTYRITQEIEQLLANGFPVPSIQVAGLTHATRGAVTERLSMIDPEQVRVLASVCYRIVREYQGGGRIKIVKADAASNRPDDSAIWNGSDKDSKEMIDRWNTEWRKQGKWPHPPITGGTSEWQQRNMVPVQEYRAGNKEFSRYSALRVAMTPQCEWPGNIHDLHEQWTAFKKRFGLSDFTDLEEMVLEMELPPEKGIQVQIWDEAQDYSALDMAVVHHLGKQMQWYYCAGDPNQVLYHWRGGTHQHFATGVAEDNLITLNKTWRCKQAIYDYGVKILQRWDGAWDYGEVEAAGPGGLVVDATRGIVKILGSQLAVEIERRLQESPEMVFMVLSSYRSNGIKDFIVELQARGIPYHNPYTNASEWTAPGTALARDLAVFLRPPWTVAEANQWLRRIKLTGVIRRGWADRLKELPGDADFPMPFLEDELFDQFMAGLTDDKEEARHWYLDRVLASQQRGAAMIRNWPIDQLGLTPRVIVGTIHSVKGGEADIVYCANELSYPDILETTEWERHSRYYTATTRARSEFQIIKGMDAQNSYQFPEVD